MPREFPSDPDWFWLRCQWQPTGLLRFDVSVQDVPADGVACLVTPLSEADGGAMLAADQAMEWIWQLGGSGVYAISPAMLALAQIEVGKPKPDPLAALARCDRAVVPPMTGRFGSIEVWRAGCAALDMNMPVYVLEQGADA